MDFFQIITDILANIILRPAVMLNLSTQIISFIFLFFAFITFIDIFAENHPEESSSSIIKWLRFGVGQKLFSTKTDIFLIFLLGIIAIRGFLIPNTGGMAIYSDPYLGFEMKMPKNWIVAYEKPSAPNLDSRFTSNNITLRSSDSSDYIFIGLIEDYVNNTFNIINPGVVKKAPVEINTVQKKHLLREEIIGTTEIKGQNILIAGNSDGALIRYLLSTIEEK